MTTWTVDRQPRTVSVLFNCQESQRLENLSDQKEALALDNSEHPNQPRDRETTGFEGLQVSCNKTRYPIVWTWHLWAVVRFSLWPSTLTSSLLCVCESPRKVYPETLYFLRGTGTAVVASEGTATV
ncbi:hypothetical protein KQX54_019781 [Cotesia glomerata]|uniref:Uncharacterized protein n=1 Tax=Cotesia glomerata TaxID=32391 RepID=A0AAV7J0Q1_COTGL|nr:hypothetical protein KQX54_019781 [Cotesia glomerata]